MKVLHIEPDQYYRQKFFELANQDLELIAVEKALDMSKFINKHKPDAIVMELFFPDVHGYDLLKNLKNHPEHSKIPIVIFSKLGDIEDIEQVMGYGVSGYFVKGANTINEVQRLLLSLM